MSTPNTIVNGMPVPTTAVGYKTAVRAAAQGPLAATRVGNVLTANAVGALTKATIDAGWIAGGALAVGDEVLLPLQAAGQDNGPYSIVDLGSGGTPWVMQRSADANTSELVVPSMLVPVSEGSDASLAFILATAAPITLNTTVLTFVLMGSTVAPLLWEPPPVDPAAQNYAPGDTVLTTYTPAAPRSQFVPTGWYIPPTVGTVTPGIRFTFSDTSQITRTNPFGATLYERAADVFFGMNGLTIVMIEFIGNNAGVLVNVDLGAFQAQGQTL